MRASVDAHFAVSSETPSVPAKRVEMNPMRRRLVGAANLPRAPSGPVIVTSPPLLEGTVPRYGRPVNRAATGWRLRAGSCPEVRIADRCTHASRQPIEGGPPVRVARGGGPPQPPQAVGLHPGR